MSTLKIVFEPPFFKWHTKPAGMLDPVREDQALWWYYVLAMGNWRDETGERLVLEGEPDLDPNYEALFRAAATLYGVDVNTLANRWDKIDAEIDRWNSYAAVLKKDIREGLFYHKLPLHLRFVNKSFEIGKGLN